MLSLRNIRTFESLAVRDFRLLWLGQITNAMGQWMDQVSRMWLVYDLTHSPMQLGLVSAFKGVPMLLFGIVAGVAADRYGGKRTLLAAQAANAILNVVLALLVLTGRVEVWHIYVTGFLAGTVQAFQNPARQVMISELVGEKHLLNAVALNSAAANTSHGLGPAVSGLLIGAFGVGVAYLVQGALYLMGTVWTVQLKVPEQQDAARQAKAGDGETFLASARGGVAHILHDRLLMGLMVLGLAPAVLGMPFVSLMPLFAIDVFQGTARTQGFLLAMLGLGSVLGALAVASFARGLGGKSLIVTTIGFGLSLVAFGQSPAFALAAVFVTAAGFMHSSYRAQNQTTLQLITPRELRGRVLGIYLLDRGLMPLGSLLAGALASLFGGPWAVTMLGILCVVLTAGTAILVPAVRNLRPVGQPEPQLRMTKLE